MNIALSVLILILLLLPGAGVVTAYASSLLTPKSSRYIAFNDLLLKGLLWSLVIHCCGICILGILNFKIHYSLIYELLAGKDLTYSDEAVGQFIRRFSIYIMAAILVPFAITKIVKRIILKNRWDIGNDALGTYNEWYWIFSGRYLIFTTGGTPDVDVIFVDILSEKEIIYSGWVIDYNLNKERDRLESIVLQEARRRHITRSKDTGEIAIGKEETIPGDVFVIPGKIILNVNFYYISQQDIKDESPELPFDNPK